jgi:hypothetical protein
MMMWLMIVIGEGFFSINALWKNKMRCRRLFYRLLLSIDNGDFDLLKISVAVREMSEGEI